MTVENPPQNTCSHIIVLDNLKDCETFSYSVVVCNGHIENFKNCKSQIIITTNCDNETCVQMNIHKNFFKCILELKYCTNVFTFEYCSSSTSVTVNYKPRKTSLTVLPLYIVCDGHDGKFQAPTSEYNSPESACRRITTCCKLMQSIFGDTFHKVEMERRSFQIESDCFMWRSKLNVSDALNMTQTELWYYFAREIMASSIGNVKRKYIAFLSCSIYDGEDYYEGITYKDMLKLVKGYVAYGGDGLALLSTACLYTWPESVEQVFARFNDTNLVDKRAFMDDSVSRGTWSGCFTTTFGAALHEICHTFDLGHSEAGVMGPNYGTLDNLFVPSSEAATFCDYRCTAVSKTNAEYMSWSKSSLVILYYHKWFNSVDDCKQSSIYYDNSTKIVKSIAGIRVIEIREKLNEMVLDAWVFTGKILKHSFQINYNEKHVGNSILFIEDSRGNIHKQQL